MGVGLRVLIVSERLYPPNGGGELSLLAIASHLMSQGSSVLLAYTGDQAPAGFQAHRLPEPVPAPGMWHRQWFNHGSWRRFVRKLIRETEPDIVLTQLEASAAAVEAARSEGVRSVVMIRGTDFLELPEAGNAGAWRHHVQRPAFWRARSRYLTALRGADAVIANSEFIASLYEPLIGRRAEVVYPAVSGPDGCVNRGAVNRVDGHFAMFSPHAHKGGHIVLEMARRMPATRFVVAGNGEPEIVEPLRRLSNVEYQSWTKEPFRLFQGACATLIPSQMDEAFGRVAIESLEHGVPAIASHCGGLPEAVGAAGVLVTQWKDAGAWCGAARKLIADRGTYAAMSASGPAQAATFDPAIQMQRFDTILRRTLSTPRRARVLVAGIPVDPVTKSQAVREIERAALNGRQIAIATVNSEFVVQAMENDDFRKALCAVDLAVPDSFGVTLALAWRGMRIPRCPGVDLTQELAARGLRLFLMGSTPSALAVAAEKLVPTEIGCYAPPFGDFDSETTEIMIERVNAFAPDVLLVALGAPRQDVWIAQNLSRLRAHAAIGVGGSFEIISGQLSRCPKALGTIGLEWAYRLMQQPWRWRRCLRLVRFLLVALTGGRA